MLHWLSAAFSTYVLHVQNKNGYQWWSGMGANFGEITVLGLVIGATKHKNCHHKRCWRTWPFVHLHPEHGWPSCKRHWNETPKHAQKP